MTDRERYEMIKANGKAAEMYAGGALRGGYLHDGVFAYHRSTTICFANGHTAKVHK